VDNRDVKNVEIPKVDNYFKAIWDLQKKLVDGYTKIEKLPSYPLNLDVKEDQLLLKDLIARVVEELAEAFEQRTVHNNEELFREELADALHFLVEVMIFVEPYEFYAPNGEDIMALNLSNVPRNRNIGDHLISTMSWWMWDVTLHLNLARNTLRNKSWKQSEVKTNKELFHKHMSGAFAFFIQGLSSPLGLGAEEVFAEYYKKNKINIFRQESRY